MTLVLSTLAAIISTVVWYVSPFRKEYRLSMLCWMFWGASLMWLVDLIMAFMEEGAAVFAPATSDLINDTYLGISVIVLALVIWVVSVLIRDPKHVLHKS